eukprot:Gregarina_sp_Pseudo_9__5338@NODE_633_length_2452_cov_19_998342_g597_i0_p4_GENE_NODE_633_length_2452_cov_19_998342_g597_i0NODE_633_length_2452_cov_19_998342_g597_i0_p4_ORF_typecomplete_len137_score22_62ING/PF12998_7/0_032_NODE_633_length_2452_cov_19_998342_g597_i040450
MAPSCSVPKFLFMISRGLLLRHCSLISWLNAKGSAEERKLQALQEAFFTLQDAQAAEDLLLQIQESQDRIAQLRKEILMASHSACALVAQRSEVQTTSDWRSPKKRPLSPPDSDADSLSLVGRKRRLRGGTNNRQA